MSSLPTDPPAPTPDEEPVPAEHELARVAVPARVRRAPKYGAFIVAGALVGAVVAVLLTVLLGGGDATSDVASGQGFISFLDGQGAVRTVMGVTGAVVGGFLGGGLAVLADRRSRDPLG
ncbi:histidine kinase [Cellulomonas sp.]|uniref:histidine kinase n=1 Tax=Cellulomonas sp. TaxID=40001 RepID=UPI002584E459|nr:histidine kinase [Cellulomonas sp.]MCR6689024.1 histidine kinase [Cellulomonas sp.]